jgi:hypothetical protein
MGVEWCMARDVGCMCIDLPPDGKKNRKTEKQKDKHPRALIEVPPERKKFNVGEPHII